MNQDLDLALRIKTELEKARKDIADLRGDVKKLGDTRRDIQQLSDTVNHLGNRLGSTGALLKKTFGALGIGLSIREIVQESVRAEAALAQVEARIKSTGGAAGFTAQQLAAQAAQLQKTTTVSDDAVLEMQSVLLSFRRIQGDVFRDATEAALDLSIGLGQDLKSSALQLGKALDDPAQGLAALSRAGVRFTNEQETMIQNFVRTGNIAAAQRIILQQVEASFGGAARAARDTLGGALAALHNAFGDLLENKGGMKEATAAINDLTERLQDPETVAAVENITTVVIKGLGAIAEFTSAVHFLIAGPSTDIGKLDRQIDDLDRKIDKLKFNLTQPRVLRARGEGFDSTGLETKIFESDESINKRLQDLATERAKLLKQLDDLQRKRGEEILKSRGVGVVPKTAAPTSAAAPVEPALVEAGLRAQRQLIKDEVERQGAELERLLQRNLVSYRDYYAQRAELQRSAIDAEIRATESALEAQRGVLKNDPTVTADQRINGLAKIKELETQMIVLRRSRADVGVRADHEEQQSTLQLLDSMDQVRERLLSAQGNTAAATRLALEREFTPLVARLEAEGNKAGIAIIEKLINIGVAKSRLDEVRQLYDRTLQQMQATEQDITAQREAGLIGELEARRRIVALHHETARALGPVIEKMRAAAVTDEQKRQVEQLAGVYRQLAAKIDPIAQRLNASMEQGLANSLEGFINGTRNAKEAFQDFANSVIQALQRIAAEQLAQQIFQGFNLGSLGAAFAGLFHRGGVVGAAGGASRAVSPLAFIGAPRLHAGALGIKRDEVPAILQEGETVLPRGARLGGTDKVSVIVENRGQPIKATDTKVDVDVEGTVVRVLVEDAQRGGPVSSTLARTFSLKRGG